MFTILVPGMVAGQFPWLLGHGAKAPQEPTLPVWLVGLLPLAHETTVQTLDGVFHVRTCSFSLPHRRKLSSIATTSRAPE